jgi:hypothetical protein
MIYDKNLNVESKADLLAALDEKFGKLPSDVPETLSNINDTKKLENPFTSGNTQ